MPPPDPPRALAVPGAIPLQDGRVYILWAKCASAQKAPGGSPMLGVLYATPTSPTWRVTEGQKDRDLQPGRDHGIAQSIDDFGD